MSFDEKSWMAVTRLTVLARERSTQTQLVDLRLRLKNPRHTPLVVEALLEFWQRAEGADPDDVRDAGELLQSDPRNARNAAMMSFALDASSVLPATDDDSDAGSGPRGAE